MLRFLGKLSSLRRLRNILEQRKKRKERKQIETNLVPGQFSVFIE
jgi:hypothetical protein